VVRTKAYAKIDGEWKEYKDETEDVESLVFEVDDKVLKEGRSVLNTTSRTARSVVAQNEGWKIGFFTTSEQEAMNRLTEIRFEKELVGINTTMMISTNT